MRMLIGHTLAGLTSGAMIGLTVAMTQGAVVGGFIGFGLGVYVWATEGQR